MLNDFVDAYDVLLEMEKEKAGSAGQLRNIDRFAVALVGMFPYVFVTGSFVTDPLWVGKQGVAHCWYVFLFNMVGFSARTKCYCCKDSSKQSNCWWSICHVSVTPLKTNYQPFLTAVNHHL